MTKKKFANEVERYHSIYKDSIHEGEFNACALEGARAFLSGLDFRADCPYTYNSVKNSVELSQFHQLYKHKLDGWFAGWHDEKVKAAEIGRVL